MRGRIKFDRKAHSKHNCRPSQDSLMAPQIGCLVLQPSLIIAHAFFIGKAR